LGINPQPGAGDAAARSEPLAGIVYAIGIDLRLAQAFFYWVFGLDAVAARATLRKSLKCLFATVTLLLSRVRSRLKSSRSQLAEVKQKRCRCNKPLSTFQVVNRKHRTP
jgi:hypothetical protein